MSRVVRGVRVFDVPNSGHVRILRVMSITLVVKVVVKNRRWSRTKLGRPIPQGHLGWNAPNGARGPRTAREKTPSPPSRRQDPTAGAFRTGARSVTRRKGKIQVSQNTVGKPRALAVSVPRRGGTGQGTPRSTPLHSRIGSILRLQRI